MAPVLSLAELPLGTSAVVERVTAGGPRGQRLRDLGFLPGTPILALRRAPLGDPRVYELRGMQLCLRVAEAAQVEVRLGE